MVASNRDDVVTVLKSKRTAIRQYGVQTLALFGSAARNRLRKRSDVDILVQFNQPTWANYIGLKFYLEDLLGREVDLVTPKGLKPAVRPSVERALLYVLS
jgi:predicted nucleotidyltransferase